MANAYKSAGVDVHAGYEAVSRIKKHVQRTLRPGASGSIGGFGGLFDMSILNLKEPVLVSGTDGVGTKLKLAFEMDRHDTIGIDAVAMCVNDIVAQGAEPLFFLDYIACGILIPQQIEAIVKGVSDGCVQAGCALIGGETAEMPLFYQSGEYDLAGFAVGVAEKSEIISGEHIKAGDVVVGLASSGIHSNGFSLVRKIVAEKGLSLEKIYDDFNAPLGEVLLTPTRIYVKTIMSLLKKVQIKGIAHITGGGFIENIPRIMPNGLGVNIDKNTWKVHEIFNFLCRCGQVPENDMYNIFNMGIGMVLVVSPQDVKKIDAPVIGEVIVGDGLHFA